MFSRLFGRFLKLSSLDHSFNLVANSLFRFLSVFKLAATQRGLAVVFMLMLCFKISKTINFSDTDRTVNEIYQREPTTITEIAQRLEISESTVSRQVGELLGIKALDLIQKGKTKEMRITLTGKILL